MQRLKKEFVCYILNRCTSPFPLSPFRGKWNFKTIRMKALSALTPSGNFLKCLSHCLSQRSHFPDENNRVQRRVKKKKKQSSCNSSNKDNTCVWPCLLYPYYNEHRVSIGSYVLLNRSTRSNVDLISIPTWEKSDLYIGGRGY